MKKKRATDFVRGGPDDHWVAGWQSFDGKWNTIAEGEWDAVLPALYKWRTDNLAEDGTPIYETRMWLKEEN